MINLKPTAAVQYSHSFSFAKNDIKRTDTSVSVISESKIPPSQTENDKKQEVNVRLNNAVVTKWQFSQNIRLFWLCLKGLFA